MKIKIMMMLAAVLMIGMAGATSYQGATTFDDNITSDHIITSMGPRKIINVYQYDVPWVGNVTVAQRSNYWPVSISTNNSVVVQAAIDALHDEYGGVMVLHDLLELPATVDLYYDVTIKGISKHKSGFYGSCDPLINIITFEKWTDPTHPTVQAGAGYWPTNNVLENLCIITTGDTNDGIFMNNTWEGPHGTNFKELYLVSMSTDVDATGELSQTGSLMNLTGYRFSTVFDCTFFGTDRKGNGLTLLDADGHTPPLGAMGVKIKDSYFWNLATGVHIESRETSPLYTASISLHGVKTNRNLKGLVAIGVNDLRVENCMFDGDYEGSIHIDNCWPVAITNNWIGPGGNYTHGINMSTLRGQGIIYILTISDNTFFGYAEEGLRGDAIHANISVSGVSRWDISHNFIEYFNNGIYIYRDQSWGVQFIRVDSNTIVLSVNGINATQIITGHVTDNTIEVTGTEISLGTNYDIISRDNL